MLFFLLVILIIVVMFIALKRPMYEAMAVAFFAVVLFSGNINHLGTYLFNTSRTYWLFSLVGFLSFSVVFERTGLINDLIDIIVALVGRFHGGAGYVALLASAAMGAFCGTGPGTAAATGSVTVPSMKRSGFSKELAAVVAAAGSTLGPVIPPTAAIPTIYAMLEVACPGQFSSTQFWMFAWPISFWLVLQRVITLYFIIKKQRIAPVPKEERLTVREALKKGWKSLILPLVLVIPFLFDMLFSDTLVRDAYGEAGKADFSAILLLVIPSLAIFTALIIYKSNGGSTRIKDLLSMGEEALSATAPIIIMIFFGAAINLVFQDMGVTASLIDVITRMNLPKWAIVFGFPLLFTILGMFMESSCLYMLFGPVFIPVAVAAGIHPMMAAMNVNVMTNAMGQLSPPFALCFIVCVGIAQADFKKAAKYTIPFLVTQYAMIILFLYEILPMFGMLK